VIREHRPFILGLVREVPELQPILDEHLRVNEPELLPHVLIADIELWAEREAAEGRTEHGGPLMRLLAYLEEVYRAETEPFALDPPGNVIAVSFIEGIPASGRPGGELRGLLGPTMARDST
jgi:hypothetical protein